MNRKQLVEFVLSERPYVDISTSMLITIKSNIRRALDEIPFDGSALSASIQKAAYTAEILDIERELIMRN